MSEGTCYEEKSEFAGENNDFIDITKTIVAFANGDGGQIVLKSLTCDAKRLDSSRLDDFVNKWVSPRVTGIESTVTSGGVCTINVASSQSSPHVITHSAAYVHGGKQRPAFYQGQIFVRHSSKSEPATADDIRQMIERAVSRALASLGDAIKRASIQLQEGGLPIATVAKGAVLEIAVQDVNKTYPYTAKTLGAALGKNQSWAAYAAGKLNLKNDSAFSMPVYGSGGKVALRKYNERALERIRRELEDNPDFDPFH